MANQKTKQLSKLCTITKGKKVKIIDKKTKDSIPYLLINTLRGKEPIYFTEDEKYTEAIPEDVLIVADGANSGLVGTGVKGAVGSTILRIRINVKDLDKDYLSYFLKSNFAKMNKDLKGTGIPHLKSKEMMEMEIRKPNLQEQQQIVQAIETQFIRLDNTIQNLKSVKGKLELYRKAVLKKAFEKKKDWEDKKLDEVCEKITQGPNPKLKETTPSENNFVLKTKDFYNNRILYDKCISIGEDLVKEWERFILKDKDVILALVGVGSIGKANIFRKQEEKNFIFTRATGLLRTLGNKLSPEYLHYYLISPLGEKLIEKGIGGTTGQLVIKTSYLKEAKITLPSLPTQKAIVSQIESKFSIIDKVEQIVNQSLIKAEMLRKSILKVAFEGRLVKEEEIID
ncbi:hypothetical protein CMI46_01000 [Candidatus Pacearchaeota archaeon]|nr:hypothetical protein [Candidatus Pacearchaeota archaeon]|tara:strand:- start:461 stop:1654 length:1194 start_codon:yes stop_codon:yes gene_type:complete